MKSSKHQLLLRSSGVLLLAVLVFELQAQEEPITRNWYCERCSQADGWEVDIEAGPAYVSEDAFRFGDYTGLDEQGFYLFGDIFARYWDEDARYVRLEGFSRGTDSGVFAIEGGKQGKYELSASYKAIPRRFYDTTVTPYRGNGSDQLDLPQDWVRAPTTQGMTALDSTATPVKIERDWEILQFGFEVKPDPRWNMQVDYIHREREGQNISAGSFQFDAAEFTTPIDYTSDDIEVALSYTEESWQTSITYYGSVFKNGNESLTWDNAYSSGTGADSGEMALAPDSYSHQVSLAGSMLLPARTTLNGQLSFGHLSQDEDLLDYTTNTSIATGALPTSSAKAEADTLNLNLRLVSSPWNKTTFEGEIRYNDFDNRTPVNTYNYVVTDNLLASTPVENSAYDYTRRDIKFRGEYRSSSKLKLHAGFDTRRVERNQQERSHTTTNKLWFRARTKVTNDTRIDFDLFTEKRDGSSYTVVENPAAQQNPLMRKYNMANRDRNGLKVQGSIFDGGRSDIGWEFELSKDDYDSSPIGLNDSQYQRIGLNYTRLLNQNASFFASLYNERIHTDQSNSQSFSTPDWSATTEDNFSTATIGVVYPRFIGSVDASLDYTWSRSVGETDNNTSGLPSDFPDLRSERQIIRLGLTYPYRKSINFHLDFSHERFESDDYALDGLEPDTVSNLLSMGADPYDYDVSVIYLGMQYRFDPD